MPASPPHERRELIQQKIKCIWQIVLKMKMLAINKITRKLKIRRFKTPNIPYT